MASVTRKARSPSSETSWPTRLIVSRPNTTRVGMWNRISGMRHFLPHSTFVRACPLWLVREYPLWGIPQYASTVERTPRNTVEGLKKKAENPEGYLRLYHTLERRDQMPKDF